MLESIIAVTVPHDWKHELIELYGARIDIVECLGAGGRGCRNFVEIAMPEARIEEAVERLRRHPTVVDADLDHVEPGRLKGTVTTRRCIGCRENLGGRAFVLGASMGADGRLVQHLLVEDNGSVRQVIAALEGRGHPTELLRLGTVASERVLTPHQEDVLSIAYSHGYFDVPRGISQHDLARMFGVSISTISEALRKGQHKLMESFFSA